MKGKKKKKIKYTGKKQKKIGKEKNWTTVTVRKRIPSSAWKKKNKQKKHKKIHKNKTKKKKP